MSLGRAENGRTNEDEPRPFFSIGITTCRRPELLREPLFSVLSQACRHFEVVLGNDDPAERISGSVLGVDGRCLRVVNHSENQGEHGNMNALLQESRGRYFASKETVRLLEFRSKALARRVLGSLRLCRREG